jgi:Purine nucleoside permease (NUP)
MIAIENLFNVGIGIVRGIVSDWNCTYQRGIEPTNYIGDIFGSLGEEPDFGFGSITEGKKIGAGGYNLGLANVEMERRKAFGLRAILK